jgi:hypothetical protein
VEEKMNRRVVQEDKEEIIEMQQSMKCSRKSKQRGWYAWRRTLMQAEQSTVAKQ